MKNAIMPVRKSTWRSSLDIDYLDETSKVKREQMERLHSKIGLKLSQFNDYASKEKIGEVHVAGFLHDAVACKPDGTGTYRGALDHNERKRRITAAWMEKLRAPVHGRGARKDVIQHRLVFSMSNELHDRCVKAGINPDKVLHQSMKRVMKKFQENFHPNDRIAYAYGFHHDTDNPHVHVALCPRTKKNNYVGYSKPKYDAKISGHRNQYAFVQKVFEGECQKWGAILSSPEKIRQLKSLKECEQFFFHQRVTKRFVKKLEETHPNRYKRISQTGILLFKIRKEVEEVETVRKVERMARLVSNCFSWKSFVPRVPILNSTSSPGKSIRAIRLKKLRADYFRLRAIYRHELKHPTPYYEKQSAAIRMANYQRYQESYSERFIQRIGISL